MAGRGPAPKNPDDRRRRNVQPEVSELATDDEVRGPDLPEGVEWHAMTVRWWETWRRSAQAQTFTDTDWSFMVDTALMHHAMWSREQWTLAAEVRLRVAKFGATPEDRARLKMSVTAEPSKPVSRRAGGMSQDRRERILRAVSDGDN